MNSLVVGVRRQWVVAVLALLLVGLLVAPVSAKENRPQRLLTFAPEYPGVVVGPEDEISMDLILHNKGKEDETVFLWVESKPDDWKVRIKTYRFDITGVHVPGGQDKMLTFKASHEKKVKPGEYIFRIGARSADRHFKFIRQIRVKVTAAKKSAESKGIVLTTSYPVLRGPSDAKFEFSIEVESRLEDDAIFDLFAKGPDGWELNFKPAYESKFISSLRLKARQSSSVALEVKPAPGAKAGQYPITVNVSSGPAKAKAELTVVLTGTYKLDVGTVDGLLSLTARRGRQANLSFFVKNTGSAPNNNIEFLSFKPENWKVEFKPEKIDTLAPGELKQVEVFITPYEDALVGDYAVDLRVEGEKVSKPLSLRVTVKASAAWGWIGIAIIVLVVLGLTTLFRKFGRR